jgi:hypothetical protein
MLILKLTREQRKSSQTLHLYELACAKTIEIHPLKEIGSG